MRRKFTIFQTHPRRLLSLLLIQTFAFLVVPFVDGSSTKLIDIAKIEKITGGPSLIKTYQLISSCSQRRVQMMFQKRIDALGDEDSLFSHLNFMSDSSGSGRIRIKGDVVKKFLCFSRNGKLINRTSGNNIKCLFKEEPHRNYIKLQSVANTKWYVGFNKRGKKFSGYRQFHKLGNEKCYMFLKTELTRDFKVKDKLQKGKFVDSLGNSFEEYQGYRRRWEK